MDNFFKGVYKKTMNEIMIHQLFKKHPTDYVFLLVGRLMALGYHVIFEFSNCSPNGKKNLCKFDVKIKEFPFLVIEVDGLGSHDDESDKKRDMFTTVTHRTSVIRVTNQQVEDNLDYVAYYIVARGLYSNQMAMAVAEEITKEKEIQEDRIKSRQAQEVQKAEDFWKETIQFFEERN